MTTDASSPSIRVLIADDHLFYREGVRALLSSAPEIAIVGEAGSGDEVVARAAELQPEVILMDLKMPGLNGIEATRRILAAQPEIGVLVVTMFDDDDSVFAVMRAGARGYRRASRRGHLQSCHRPTHDELFCQPAQGGGRIRLGVSRPDRPRARNI